MSEPFVLSEVADGIGRLILNDPARLNPVNGERIRELGAAAAAMSARDDVHVVIITGAGRGFCSGADLTPPASPPQPVVGPRTALPASGAVTGAGAGLWTLTAIRQPVIAMVNGPAIGFGAELALQADFRFAGRSARVRFPFAEMGVISDTGAGSWLLPRLIGWSRAADLLYSSRMVESDEAAAIGLFNHVVPDDELHAFTDAYARRLAGNSAWALRTIKGMLFAGLDETKREHVMEQYLRFNEVDPNWHLAAIARRQRERA